MYTKMYTRGLAGLLAMPPILRPRLLQAALATDLLPSSSRLYSVQATRSKAVKPSKPSKPPKNAKVSKSSRPTTPSTRTKPVVKSSKPVVKSSKPPTTLKSTAGSTRPKPAKSSKPAKPLKATAPSMRPKTDKHSKTLKPSKYSMPAPPVSIEDRTTLSFFPTPPTILPRRADITDKAPAVDTNKSNGLFHSPEFLYSAPRFLHLPRNSYMPEICVLGRSNVGKSTLINAIAGLGGKKAGQSHGSKNNRAGIAITSATAGCTKTMNAYGFGPPMSVPPLSKEQQEGRKEGGRGRTERRSAPKLANEPRPRHSLILMDMPGYGLNSRQDWGAEILKYLNRREILYGAILLIDALVGIKPGDRMVLEVLRDAGLKTSIVMTKADKLIKLGKEFATEENTKSLQEKCLQIWEEIRTIERAGNSDWLEGQGWNQEIFVTGAGDPKFGGFGVDGARLAICRLAGLVKEPVRSFEESAPKVVPFDQLSLFGPPAPKPVAAPVATPADKFNAPEPVQVEAPVRRGRIRPRIALRARAPFTPAPLVTPSPMVAPAPAVKPVRASTPVISPDGKVRPWRAAREVDPMAQMYAAMDSGKKATKRSLGRATF